MISSIRLPNCETRSPRSCGMDIENCCFFSHSTSKFATTFEFFPRMGRLKTTSLTRLISDFSGAWQVWNLHKTDQQDRGRVKWLSKTGNHRFSVFPSYPSAFSKRKSARWPPVRQINGNIVTQHEPITLLSKISTTSSIEETRRKSDRVGNSERNYFFFCLISMDCYLGWSSKWSISRWR